MTVKELIEALSEYPQDKEVRFTYNYGDYWHTEVAQNPKSIEMGEIIYSDYHQTDKVVEGEENSKTVVLIS